jgi:hypothetical protein
VNFNKELIKRKTFYLGARFFGRTLIKSFVDSGLSGNYLTILAGSVAKTSE